MSKIIPSIVISDTVNMVNFYIRPRTSHDNKRQPMRFISTTVNIDVAISVRVHCSGRLPSETFNFTVSVSIVGPSLPTEEPRLGVIIENCANLLARRAFHHVVDVGHAATSTTLMPKIASTSFFLMR